MTRSQLPLLLTATVVGAAATLLFLNRRADGPPSPSPAPPVVAPVVDRQPVEPAEPEPEPIAEMAEQESDTPATPAEALENAGVGVARSDPGALMAEIGEALEAGDYAEVGRLIGKDALDAETRARLGAMAERGPLRFARPDAAREVGELSVNEHTRWALRLEGAEDGRDGIFFDLLRDGGRWKVDSLTLPPAPGEPVPRAVLVDSLGIADAFLQAALRQEFELAKEFVDADKVSDAKIAALCILFEEGRYQLRPHKPLRAMFQREALAGYLANVEIPGDESTAQFSMTLAREGEPPNWRLTEINLDSLLADHARRIGGGDVYYTPLIKNPQGGDTLVLYFGFDSDEVTPRTRRQLEIVAELLMLDPEKKLTISGHTDALGTEDYNKTLSGRRAAAVKACLVECGVAESQVETVAAGQTQPRRPNFTEDGEDNPDGRRANRRSEIYLDF